MRVHAGAIGFVSATLEWLMAMRSSGNRPSGAATPGVVVGSCSIAGARKAGAAALRGQIGKPDLKGG
jgi:hypothetical protein